MKRILELVLLTLVLCAGCAIGAKDRVGVGLQETSKENGIFVKDVKVGSAAQKAGLQPGDVIVAYQGKSIVDPTFVEKDIETSPIGKKIQMTIVRAGRPLLLEMAIEKKPSRVVNVSAPGQTPDYSLMVADVLWIGSYPYPASFKEIMDPIKLLPRAIQEQDQMPATPATVFSVTVR